MATLRLSLVPTAKEKDFRTNQSHVELARVSNLGKSDSKTSTQSSDDYAESFMDFDLTPYVAEEILNRHHCAFLYLEENVIGGG